jgi:hypothetical protein
MKPARHQPAVPLVDSTHEEERFPYHWRMADEFAFLRHLGTWRPRHSVTDRAQVLRGYLEGLALRRRWVGLECEALECEARLLLEQLNGGGAA